MLATIENAYLKLTVDTHGAQMMSVCGKDGCEYLWQGDPAYWEDRAPVLFPVIGRLQNRQYQLHGKRYLIESHGFACREEFSIVTHTADTLVLALPDTIATWVNYPFEFLFEITYQLVDNTILVRNSVKNKSGVTMHFAIGGHPGFRVPLNVDETFEDYYLEFGQCCYPDRIGFTTDTVLVNGQTERLSLIDSRVLPLKHDLFDNDAIILQNASREVALKSHCSGRAVVVRYPDMPYIGFWHWPKKDAPYVCIEPWTSLPGRSDTVEDISCRSDYVHLADGKTYVNTWSIEIIQED